MRYGLNEEAVTVCHTLRDNGRVTTEEVHPHLLRCSVECERNLYIVFWRLTAVGTDERDRSNGNTLIDNRYSKLLRNLVSCLYEVFCEGCYLLIDILASFLKRAVCAGEKRDAHGYSSNVEVLLLDHLIGLNDLRNVYHSFSLFLFDVTAG